MPLTGVMLIYRSEIVKPIIPPVTVLFVSCHKKLRDPITKMFCTKDTITVIHISHTSTKSSSKIEIHSRILKHDLDRINKNQHSETQLIIWFSMFKLQITQGRIKFNQLNTIINQYKKKKLWIEAQRLSMLQLFI